MLPIAATLLGLFARAGEPIDTAKTKLTLEPNDRGLALAKLADLPAGTLSLAGFRTKPFAGVHFLGTTLTQDEGSSSTVLVLSFDKESALDLEFSRRVVKSHHEPDAGTIVETDAVQRFLVHVDIAAQNASPPRAVGTGTETKAHLWLSEDEPQFVDVRPKEPLLLGISMGSASKAGGEQVGPIGLRIQ